MKRSTMRLVFLAALVGCGQDFEPYARLSKLRVLAIGAEPAAPGPGETATISALIYAKPGAPPADYAWSWCPFPGASTEGYPCAVTEDEVRMLAGATGMNVPPFDLGTAATASFPHTIDPAILATLCRGVMGAPSAPDCEFGFPVQLKLVVSSGDETLTAVAKLRLRFDAARTPNASPRFGAAGLAAVIDGTDWSLGSPPLVTLPRAHATTVKAAVDVSQSEPYLGKADDGSPLEMRERLTLSWFVEGGDLDHERTGFIEGVVPIDKATVNRWTPLPVEADARADRGTARLYVVLKDNRGGVSWTEGAASLAPSP